MQPKALSMEGVFAGEGAGLVNVGVLGTVGDLAAGGQLFNQTQR